MQHLTILLFFNSSVKSLKSNLLSLRNCKNVFINLSLPMLFFHFCLCYKGVVGADVSELRKVVSEPYGEHLLQCADFSLLETLLPKLSRRLCFSASEPPRPVKTSQPGKFFHQILPVLLLLYSMIIMSCNES